MMALSIPIPGSRTARGIAGGHAKHSRRGRGIGHVSACLAFSQSNSGTLRLACSGKRAEDHRGRQLLHRRALPTPGMQAEQAAPQLPQLEARTRGIRPSHRILHVAFAAAGRRHQHSLHTPHQYLLSHRRTASFTDLKAATTIRAAATAIARTYGTTSTRHRSFFPTCPLVAGIRISTQYRYKWPDGLPFLFARRQTDLAKGRSRRTDGVPYQALPRMEAER